ncbi:DUF4399 domain-containing protein [Polynucleobacter antarcticus]|uniref:Rod shape-determining protein RodA n=1 Tax=Polynucleobacter antarcticus TaxID=1743162 RepID=A0A6M9PJV4_9BURK|nr:DUF4399 domain-containing protein [Polynucleobacter antarcticus]QKM62404.1 rod shape-determining protein RodA [Polynucleobacter antarcticus]
MRRFISYSLAVISISLLASCASMQDSKNVYFVAPADGATVTSPFMVKFGVTGMDLKPAGDATPNSGHHHLLINLASMPEGQSIPFNATHMHFGKAQSEAEIKLPPGKYTLTMQFGNKDHLSYGAPMSKSITVTVK